MHLNDLDKQYVGIAFGLKLLHLNKRLSFHYQRLNPERSAGKPRELPRKTHATPYVHTNLRKNTPGEGCLA